MPEAQYKVDLPAFTGRNVPIKEIAQAMGKDAQLDFNREFSNSEPQLK